MSKIYYLIDARHSLSFRMVKFSFSHEGLPRAHNEQLYSGLG